MAVYGSALGMAIGTRTMIFQSFWRVVVAGHSIREGHLRYPLETPMNNLYMSLLTVWVFTQKP